MADELFRGPFDKPEGFPGVRIKAGDTAIAALDELGAAGQLPDERRAVADPLVLALHPPGDFPVRPVQSHQEGIALAVAVNDDFVAEQHRFVAEPPLAGMRSGPGQPKLFAGGQVVRGDDNVIPHSEHGIDPFPIGGWRAGGIAVFVMYLFERALHNRLLPELLAGSPVEAEEHALLRSGQAGHRADAIAPNDG